VASVHLTKQYPARWWWALLAATVFVVSGCSAVEQGPVDELASKIDSAGDFEGEIEASLGDDAELEIDLESESFRVKVGGADFSEGPDLDRPEWLAAEIPLPPGLEITSVLVIETFRILRGVTDASADEIGGFYRAAFESAGFTIEQAWDATQPIAMKARAPSGDPITLEYRAEEFVLVVGRE
jgi:hypothetical protein